MEKMLSFEEATNLVELLFPNSEDSDEIKLEDLGADKIGRGIWHSWHITATKAQSKADLIVIFHFILLYINSMICEICHEHAVEFINKYDITTIMLDKDITFTELYDIFNQWLYCFHRSANNHAGKKSISYSQFLKFYSNIERCDDGCGI